jgi:glycosyltransferase involved in cell wall biosynthesis
MRRHSSDNLARKKILIVLTTLDLGGAERQALHLASYLKDQRGAQVAIAGLFGGLGNQAVRSLWVERRLPCLRLSMPEHTEAIPTFRSIRQFCRELRFLQPALLLPFTSLPNVLCGLTWRTAGAKACIWNQRDAGMQLPRKRWQIAALANTPWFLTNARSGMDCLVNQHGVPAQRVRLVFNGVTLPPGRESREDLRRRLGIGQDSPVGVMLANIHLYKDHATLVRAWKVIDREMVGLKPTLLLAGRRDNTENLRALVAELKLDERVRFLGAIDDVASLLNAADVSLLSSDSEGTPNAVLESMAAARVVVATDLPGCRDALGEDYPFLVPARNPNQFARGILELFRNADKRATIGQILQLRANRKFTVERMCSETCALLEEALSGG